jgi:hypothetical protein
MNIIFGMESVTAVEERYTVLELDTFVLRPTNEVITAYCLVDTVPIQEMPVINSLKQQHADLMAEYRKQNWNFCETAIAHLTGKWGGELDSFYTELYQRILALKHQDLPDTWTGYLDRAVEVV